MPLASGLLLWLAGSISVPGSSVSASLYQLVLPGAAGDGSQDQLLGVLAGSLESTAPLLQLMAAQSPGPVGGDLLA